MYQRFIAVGRLGRDPEVSGTANGARMATMSLATSEYVKGEERTEWHRVVVWDEKLVEVIERRAKKGTLVAVEGQVRTRKWQKDGRDVASTEIVLDRFNSRLQILANSRNEAGAEDAADAVPRPAPAKAHGRELDEELPF